MEQEAPPIIVTSQIESIKATKAVLDQEVHKRFCGLFYSVGQLILPKKVYRSKEVMTFSSR
jgi:hypothetical protein